MSDGVLTGGVTIAPVGPGDAGRLRELRLRALRSDPDAFGATYERDRARPGGWWTRWAEASAHGDDERTFVVVAPDGRWLGLALVRREAGEPGTAGLYAMWVAPEARGHGAGRALCDACAGWARSRGCDTLRLTVFHGNVAARRAYRAAGFTDAGTSTTACDGCPAGELVMTRAV